MSSIDILDCRIKSNLDFVKENLKKYQNLLNKPYEFVIYDIIQGSACVFKVSDSLYCIGWVYTKGITRIFCCYFVFGKDVKICLPRIYNYLKDELNCDGMEFIAWSDGRRKLYDRLFHSYNKKRGYIYNVVF